jgi:hypothetical protein
VVLADERSGTTLEQSATSETEVPVCLMLPIFQNRGGGYGTNAAQPVGDAVTPFRDEVYHWVALSWAKAALLALDHVNNADCAVLGPDCAEGLEFGDGSSNGRVRLRPYLADLQTRSAADAPPAAKNCIETDAMFVVAHTTSDQSGLVAAFLGGFGACRALYYFLLFYFSRCCIRLISPTSM